MFPFDAASRLVGVMSRRLKWHRCEFNRIYAWKDHLQSEMAFQALYPHYIAIRELTTLSNLAEPNWEGEMEITKSFYNWKTDADDTPEEAFQKLLAQRPKQPACQELQETGDPHGHPTEGSKEDSEDIGGDSDLREWHGGTA